MSSGTEEMKVFLGRARASSGPLLVPLIQEAISCPRVFSFGELLLLPSIQELRGGEHDSSLQSLELFAYGTLKDFIANRDKFISLTDEQISRLKLLTLVSLASQRKVLTYATLHDELDTSSNRELEDIVIDAVYHGLVTAKIDQKHQVLRILRSSSRDITPRDIDAIVQDICAWRKQCIGLISTLQESSAELATQRKLNSAESEAVGVVVAAGVKDLLYGDDTKEGAPSGVGGISLFSRHRPKRSRVLNSGI